LGSATSGLLAYVFFAIVARWLGSAAASPVSVLWTYWGFSAAAITFPLQHWISRAATASGGEAVVRRTLPRILLLVAGIAVVTTVLAWAGRSALFHRSDSSFPLLIGAVTLGSGFIGLIRGGLSARRMFGSVAWALVLENGARCLYAVALQLAHVRSSVWFGLALAAGPLIGLRWASLLRFRHDGWRPESIASPIRFLRNAAVGSLIGQAVLTGGPVGLALAGGEPAAVTALFAGLALFRAPYTLVIGLLAPVTGRLTALAVSGREDRLSTVRMAVVTGTMAAAVLAALVGGLAGPGLIRLIFGDGVRLGSLPATLIAVGSAVALANLLMNVSLMARDRSAAVTQMWLIGAGAGGTVFLTIGQSATLRTCWAFVIAESVAFVVALAHDARSGPPAGGTDQLITARWITSALMATRSGRARR
jgi:O-antigen/teichoic acid export membrane protein